MIRLKDILKESEAERNNAMITGVAEILRGVDDMANRKILAFNMMDKFRREGVPFQKQQFLSMCGIPGSMMVEGKQALKEVFRKGEIYGGSLKINGQKVPVEVELLGSDEKTKTYTAKLIHFDKKWASKMPPDGILNIPARIFRVPGGGWHKIKTPNAFEQEMTEADSPTERTRRYNRKNKKKVRAYLKSTQDDRVARNRDRAKAVKKNGESKMKNKDVHHLGKPTNSKWRTVRKDHGPGQSGKL
jgi:hypothetical protein